MSQISMLEKMELIDLDLIENASRKKNKQKYRGISRFAAVAACFFVVFAVAVTTSFAMNLGGIREWFMSEWYNLTGNLMTDEHTAVIDHLSQDIGITKTVEDVSITVDSAAVGRDSFYLLLRVNGLSMNSNHSYGFSNVSLTMRPDPVDELSAFAGYGLEYLGIDEEKNSVFLLSHEFFYSGRYGIEESGSGRSHEW